MTEEILKKREEKRARAAALNARFFAEQKAKLDEHLRIAQEAAEGRVASPAAEAKEPAAVKEAPAPAAAPAANKATAIMTFFFFICIELTYSPLQDFKAIKTIKMAHVSGGDTASANKSSRCYQHVCVLYWSSCRDQPRLLGTKSFHYRRG